VWRLCLLFCCVTLRLIMAMKVMKYLCEDKRLLFCCVSLRLIEAMDKMR
jgi:hypothetical protein